MDYENSTNYIDDATTCVSEAVKEYLVTNGMKRDDVIVINNGLDIERSNNVPVDKLYLHKELNLDPQIKIIGMVAYFYNLELKGHKTFLDAAKIICDKFDKVRFIIVGSDIFGGNSKKHFEDYAKEIGIQDKVYFLGERDDILSLMDSFYLHVLPTISEGFGMVLLEAMARKIPNIASRIVAIKEIITDRENGLLFETGDQQALAGDIEFLINNSELSKKMGISGRFRLESDFDSKTMTLKYENLFKKLHKEERPAKSRASKIIKLIFISVKYMLKKGFGRFYSFFRPFK
jgi:glycosyltransferase involved in cell wall biosynthesis